MIIHFVFDLLAWLSAWMVGRFVASRGYLRAPARTPASDPGYFIALGLGAIAGALLAGSGNMNLAGIWQVGHSVAGGIAGGIVGVEIFKRLRGIQGSTGGQFVAPLAAGIALGRLGCFFAGLPDYTYGVPTALPWGVDFGDGVPRHPVQLYESAAMLIFLATYLRGLAEDSYLFLRQGFYIFVAWYGAQRFVWEFLKPYPAVVGPFNLFHILCAAMIGYSFFMMRKNHEFREAVPEL